MSCISASEITNETSFDEINSNNVIINAPEINDFSWNGPEITKGVIILPDSQDALQTIFDYMNDGDTYVFDRDYHFNDLVMRGADDRFVTIDKNNVVIDGNGHTIDGGGDIGYSIFKVTGNNVKIFNFTFTNSHPQENGYGKVMSPVYWSGNDGSLSNCLFYENAATNGGAVTWRGDNGIIDNCVFVNNTATGVGGGVYVDYCQGTLISNCLFLNTTSLTTGEAVFLDRTSKRTTFENIFLDNIRPLIEGKQAEISIDYYSNQEYNSYITDINVNIIPLIYSSIAVGGIQTMDNGISYYAQYFNDTYEFVFTVTREFEEYGIYYSKDYIFNNITTGFNEVFNNLFNENYSNEISIIVNRIVNTGIDYNNVRGTSYSYCTKAISAQLDTDIKNCKHLKSTVKALNVVFTKTLTITNPDPWNLKEMGFNVVNINGNDSTIKGSFKERNEDKWGVIGENEVFTASNITITGFNTAIENMGGFCIFNNVKFLENKMDYMIDRDWGAAILNIGNIICNNCTFEKNSAKNGGAIFNQGFIDLENCTFINNNARGKGDNVCVGDGGKVMINGQNITSDNSIVYFAESMSAATSTWIAIGAIAVSYVAGLIAGAVSGLFTANPVVGVLVGAAVGAGIGSLAAGWIISEHYDINFNRLKTAIILIAGCSLSGAVGGLFGNQISAYYQILQNTAAGYQGMNWGYSSAILGIPLVALSGIGGITYYFSY